MSGETIRDVVIKVSVQAGDTSALKAVAQEIKESLGSAMNAGGGSSSSSSAASSMTDTQTAAKAAAQEVSAFNKMLEAAIARAKDLSQAMAEVAKNSNQGNNLGWPTAGGGGIGSSAGGRSVGGSRSGSVTNVATEIKEWFSDLQEVALSTIKPGHQGYAESVRKRSVEFSQKEMEFAHGAGLTDNLDESRTNQLREHLTRRAAAKIKEQDSEHAATSRDNEAALKSRGAAAMSAAKGILQLGAATDQDTASMVRNVVAIEGFFNVAKNISSLVGPKASLGGLLVGGGLTAIVGELMLAKQAFDEARGSSERYWTELAQDAERVSHRVSSNAFRRHDLAVQNAMERPDISASDRLGITIPAGEALEQRMRGIDSDYSLTPGQRASARSRAERQHSLGVERLEASDRVSDIDQRLADLQKAKAVLEAEKPNIEESSKAAVDGHRKRAEHATDETIYGTAGRKLYEHVANQSGLGLIFNTGIDTKTGMWQSQSETKLSAEQDAVAAEKEGKEQLATINNKLIANEKEQVDLAKEKVAALAKQYNSTKEMRQAAYESVREEKDRIRGVSVSFGSSSLEARNRALRIQAKHDQIMAEEAAGVAPEKRTQYTQEEMNDPLALQSVARKTIEAQALRIKKESGFREDTDLAQREADAAQTEKVELPNQDKIKKDLAEARASLKELTDQLGERMEASLSINSVLETVTSKLEEIKAKNDSEIALFKLKFRGN